MADHRNFDSAGKEDISSELQEIKIEYNHEKIMDLEYFRKKEKRPTIYRVPDVLHKMNERAYTPSIVAIGPLHRGKEHLQAMEEEKRTYTNFLFYRTGNVEQTRHLCSSAMLEMVSEAKRCYAEDVRLHDNIFAEMMLVDGCFMIELFYRCKRDVFDPILKNTFKRPEIQQDLILLENQIPFEVLQKLFNLTVKRIPPENGNGGPSLTECVLSFYWDVTSPSREESNLKKKDHKTTFHVLHLLHSCHLPQEKAEVPPEHYSPPEEAEVPSHHLPLEEGEVRLYHLPREEGEVSSPLLSREEAQISPIQIHYSLPPEEADLTRDEGEDPSQHLPQEEEVVNKTGSSYKVECARQLPKTVTVDRQLPVTALCAVTLARQLPVTALCARQLPKKKKENSEAEMVLRNFKYSATELDLGGIKIVKLNNKKDIFHVEFLPHVGFWRRGQFKIPPFLVDDFTELFWRNFIAFEQSCHFITRSYFTAHALLMDRLINTTEDVQLLEEQGIIFNTMGSPEEVANLFNNLCNNIHIKEFNSTKACKEVINFRKQLWPKFLVKLRRDYFSNPWTAISVLAATGLFVLTLLQTIYTTRS